MQIEIQTTDEQRKNAVKRITFEKRLPKIVISSLLIFFMFSYCIASFIRNWGNVPLTVFVLRLVYNPLFWIIAIILIGIFAKNNSFDSLQAQHLNGFANFRDSYMLQISEDGIACYNKEQNIGAFTYHCFSDAIRTKDAILLADKSIVLFILPLSSFSSEKEIDTIFSYINNKIDIANTFYKQQISLEIEPKESLSSFSYLQGSLTSTQISKGIQNLLVPKKKWKTVYILMTVLGLLGCFAMIFFVPPIEFLPTFVLLSALYLTILAIARQKSSTPINHEYLPYFFYGNTTLEILTEGIRTYNKQFEIFFNWEQPYRIVETDSCYILTLYGSFLGYIPILYGAYSDDQNLEKTIEYITSSQIITSDLSSAPAL